MSKNKKQKIDREGKLLVELSQKFGWTFLSKPPKVSLMFDRKTNVCEPHYEYHIMVPKTSKLVELIPPKVKAKR